MSRTELRRKAWESRLSYRQPRDLYVALGFSVVALLLHTYAQVAEYRAAASFTTLRSPFIPLLYLLMEAGLAANLLGLWLRRTAGFVISVAALLSVAASYAVWYAYSRELLDALRSNPFYLAHPEALPPYQLGLVGATLPNVAVLAMTAVLLVWELKTLRGMARPGRT